MKASAITDHGVCSGFIQHYKACKKEDIKCILGCELYLSPTDDHTLKEKREEFPAQQCYHLTALAKNAKGVSQLYELSSRGFLEGYYYKPRVSLPMIEEIGKDLIILGACAKGPVCWNIREGKEDIAQQWLVRLREMFKGRFYLELMDHGLDWQKELNISLRALSKKYEIPWVPSNDCHFLKKENHYEHSIMMCLQTKSTMENLPMKYPEECYLKTPEEMAKIFGEDSCQRTVSIAEQITIELTLDEAIFPIYNNE
jgi:DNA polymerase-3 subunit alpha